MCLHHAAEVRHHARGNGIDCGFRINRAPLDQCHRPGHIGAEHVGQILPRRYPSLGQLQHFLRGDIPLCHHLPKRARHPVNGIGASAQARHGVANRRQFGQHIVGAESHRHHALRRLHQIGKLERCAGGKFRQIVEIGGGGLGAAQHRRERNLRLFAHGIEAESQLAQNPQRHSEGRRHRRAHARQLRRHALRRPRQPLLESVYSCIGLAAIGGDNAA